MPPKRRSHTSLDDVANKIAKSSSLTTESKEIFSTFLSFVSCITEDRDHKITSLEQKVEQNRILYEERAKKQDEIISALESSLEFSQKSYDERMDQLQNKVITLEKKISDNNSENKIQELRNYVDENDAYERRDSLIISGKCIKPWTKGEDCKVIVHELLRDKIGYNLSKDHISIAHRSGKKPENGAVDKRQIRFRVCKRDLVYDIISACKESQKDIEEISQRLFINVSLTPLRSKILFGLRKLRKEHPSKIKSCRSNYTGNIEVYTPRPGATDPRNNNRNIINTRAALEVFASRNLNVDIDSLGITW